MKSLLIRGVVLVTLLACVFVVLYTAFASRASAYNPGCERVRWGFLGSQYRTICDGPIRSDGSWERAREIWHPARWVPGYCGTYYCSAGYQTTQGTDAFEKYVVFPNNVLPDEPGWLPPGSLVMR